MDKYKRVVFLLTLPSPSHWEGEEGRREKKDILLFEQYRLPENYSESNMLTNSKIRHNFKLFFVSFEEVVTSTVAREKPGSNRHKPSRQDGALPIMLFSL